MDKYMFVNCSLYLGCLEEEGGGGDLSCGLGIYMFVLINVYCFY